MHNEIISYPGTKWGSALLLGGIVLATILLSWLSGIFYQAGMAYLDLLAFLALVLMLAAVIRQRIFRYRYCVVDNELIVSRLCGQKEKHLLSLDMEQIEEYCPYTKEAAKALPAQKRVVRGCIPTRRLKKMLLLLTEDGMTTCLLLQPSPKLDAIIRQHKEKQG